MGSVGTLEEKDAEIIDKYVEDLSVQQRIFAQDAVIKHKNSKLRIEIPTQLLQRQPRGSYNLIAGKAVLFNGVGFNRQLEMDCRVACGHWCKLGSLQGDKVNIIDHLDKLLPKQGRCIGLFSFQNGIQNSPDDFAKMGEQITANLQAEKPLCIGFYNKTNGIGLPITLDLERLLDEWNLNPHPILFMRQMMVTMTELLPAINPNLLWAHIAHSEGGLISNGIFTTPQNGLSVGQGNILKNIMIAATYGAVAPIPNKIREVLNSYSKYDIALKLVGKYLDKVPRPDYQLGKSDQEINEIAQQIHNTMFGSKKPVDTIFQELKRGQESLYKSAFIDTYPYTCTKHGCTVKVVDSKVSKKELPLIEGDHAFTGATYEATLEADIKYFRVKFRIYNGA